MKAIVAGDKIQYISERNGTVEIGTPPPGVGLERLRWTGAELVDIATLSQIWVRPIGGDSFDLHATEMPGTQLVTMTYQDRKRLMIDGGQIRLKTVGEIEEDTKRQHTDMLKNRLRRRLKKKNGDVNDQIADAFKLIFLLIVYSRTKPQVISDFFDAIIPTIKDVYDLDTVKATLIKIGQELKTELPAYYQDKENIQTQPLEATSSSAITPPK